MTDVIFVGPSLSGDEALQRLVGVTIRGPAAAGDVLQAVEAGARRVGLIDGYFDQRLSVWHKEILWALSRGVHVYGGGSMGALRAAELYPFGMVGVGVIFDWYRSGVIESDDEVAVVHEGEETGYRGTSDAMVNIRATLGAARRMGVIEPEQEHALVALGRSMFYPSRHMRDLVRRARAMGGSAEAYNRLERWLGQGRGLPINQKREDALSLLELMCANRERDSRPFAPAFEFEYTEVWHELLRRNRSRARGAAGVGTRSTQCDPVSVDAWREQSTAVRRAAPPDAITLGDGTVAAETWERALQRVLAAHLASGMNIQADAEETQLAADDFRRRHGLLTTEQTRGWLDARGLSMATFSRLMHDDVILGKCTAALHQLVMAEAENLRRLTVEDRNCIASTTAISSGYGKPRGY